jgi:hypothetical protein
MQMEIDRDGYRKIDFLGPVIAAGLFSVALLLLALLYSVVAIGIGPGMLLDSVPTVSEWTQKIVQYLFLGASIWSCVWLCKKLLKTKS